MFFSISFILTSNYNKWKEVIKIKIYTGIGSRETPIHILNFFVVIGNYLASEGYTLRSGHAPGADQAFEEGCDQVNGKKEIYLPWPNFEGSDSELILRMGWAFKTAEKFHVNRVSQLP